jgi:hypothetical protein
VATLDGVMASSLMFCNATAVALIEIWKKRRAQPALLPQPREQWRDGRSSSSPGFDGYQPGTVPFGADQLTSDSTFIPRVRAAALDVVGKPKWSTFD